MGQRQHAGNAGQRQAGEISDEAAQLAGADALALSVALQKAYWERCIDVGNKGPRAEVATEAGFDGAALSAMEDSAEVAEQRTRMFAAAEAAGVFGSPTYVLDGEIYWGQDRLDFLAEALEAARVTETA